MKIYIALLSAYALVVKAGDPSFSCNFTTDFCGMQSNWDSGKQPSQPVWWKMPPAATQFIKMQDFKFRDTDIYWIPNATENDPYIVTPVQKGKDQVSLWTPPIAFPSSNKTIVTFQYQMGQIGIGNLTVSVVMGTKDENGPGPCYATQHQDTLEMFRTNGNHGKDFLSQGIMIDMEELKNIVSTASMCGEIGAMDETRFYVRFGVTPGSPWAFDEDFAAEFSGKQSFGLPGVALKNISIYDGTPENVKQYLIREDPPSTDDMTKAGVNTLCTFEPWTTNGNLNCDQPSVLNVPTDSAWKIGPTPPQDTTPIVPLDNPTNIPSINDPKLGVRLISANSGSDSGDAHGLLQGRYLVMQSNNFAANNLSATGTFTLTYQPNLGDASLAAVKQLSFQYHSYGDVQCCSKMSVKVLKTNGLMYALPPIKFIGNTVNAWLGYSAKVRNLEPNDKFIFEGHVCKDSGHNAIDDIVIMEMPDAGSDITLPLVDNTQSLDVTVNTPPICPGSAIPCNDFTGCVELSQLCDNQKQCADGSDENSCDAYLKCGQIDSSFFPDEAPASTPSRTPWLVSINWRDLTGKSRQLCGGSLIHPKWVVTSASCVQEMLDERIDNIFVRVGVQNLAQMNAPSVVEIAVDKFKITNNYQWINGGSNVDNTATFPDIGLISLQKWALFTKDVSAACLPKVGESSPAGQCLVSGWVSNGDNLTPRSMLVSNEEGENRVGWPFQVRANPSGFTSPTCPKLDVYSRLLIILQSYLKSYTGVPSEYELRSANTKQKAIGMGYVDMSFCTKTYGINDTGTITNINWCLANDEPAAKHDNNFCAYNSGGSVSCRNPTSGAYELRGVVSSHSICDGDGTILPSLFGKVDYAVDTLVDWMARITYAENH